MLLQGVSASAAEVIVGETKPRLVPTLQHLRDLCGGSVSYDACTRFVAYRLTASCAPDGEKWRAHTSATFTPWIALWNMHQLAHELDHVADIRQFVMDRLNTIEASVFDAQADCEQRTIVEQKSFEQTLRDAAMKSNALRHPFAYGRLAR